MKTYVLNIWDNVRSSYWFIPSILVFFAACLSAVMPNVTSEFLNIEFPNWIKTTTDSARTTLSTITGAMISVTGTVFSITIVTLSLTSQQFGPRLLRNFMLDRTTQVTLGVFLSTALYSVLILRIVEKETDSYQPPHLAVLMAVVLMVISVAMLIIFIHHIAVLIQAPKIVDNVGNELDASIDRLFPDNVSDLKVDSQKAVQVEVQLSGHKFTTLKSEKEGYIQGINTEGLIEYASSQNLTIKFLYKPGAFITNDSDFVEIHGLKDQEPDQDILNDSLIVGIKRTPRQDFECAVSELVEVAVRSLSPGINDPFTAINCIDRLGASLKHLAKKSMPTGYWSDEKGAVRLILPSTDFIAVLDAAFNQIRQNATSCVPVIIRMLEALTDILSVTERENDIEAIKIHAEKVFRLEGTCSEPEDKKDIKNRYDKLLSTFA